MEHGNSAYNKNICRCKICRDAHAAYNRDQRAGRLKKVSSEERFWAKINLYGEIPANCPELGMCWEWLGAKNWQGYGMMARKLDGKNTMMTAYRFAYEMIIGSVGNNLHLDHLCRNPACCNPLHLEAVPMSENLLRGHLQRVASYCPEGHEYSGLENFRHCPECLKFRSIAVDKLNKFI